MNLKDGPPLTGGPGITPVWPRKWFWYDTMHIGYEEMVTDVIDVPVITGGRRIIDSKAMRKVRNREVQIVVENTTIGAAAAVNVALTGRYLTGS